MGKSREEELCKILCSCHLPSKPQLFVVLSTRQVKTTHSSHHHRLRMMDINFVPVALALAALPYVGFGAFIQYCQKYLDLSEHIDTTDPILRKALYVHFWYFISVPIMIEVFPDAVPGIDYLVGTMPPTYTSNGFHMLQCLAAENFFVTSASLGFLLTQRSVPRWTFMTPFAQLAWNLKNPGSSSLLHRKAECHLH